MVFGYVRVSTREQNEDRQVEAIKQYCNDKGLVLEDRNIIIDKQSGKDFNREGYQLLKNFLLRSGDTLIIKELDRLGRDMDQIKQEWQELTSRGINIIVLDTPILNTADRTDLEKKLIANIVFELLAYLAEKEREKIRQRQREGIEAAKKAGKHLGRPRIDYITLSKQQKELIKQYYQQWKNKEITAVRFMEIVGLKKNTFYKVIKQYEKSCEFRF
ncbi:MAG TPA: recombinase family protein [Tissierellaceae bacterium]